MKLLQQNTENLNPWITEWKKIVWVTGAILRESMFEGNSKTIRVIESSGLSESHCTFALNEGRKLREALQDI